MESRAVQGFAGPLDRLLGPGPMRWCWRVSLAMWASRSCWERNGN